jgi:uncharacterized protein (DUF983 family)
MKKYLTLTIIGTIIIYLVFSFIQWEFNAGLWQKETRIFISLLVIGWLAISALIRAAIHSYE